jgi:hypothetical protein
MTTVPLRFPPPLHINSPPVVFKGKNMTFCPDSMGCIIFDFQFQISRPPMGRCAARKKDFGTSWSAARNASVTSTLCRVASRKNIRPIVTPPIFQKITSRLRACGGKWRRDDQEHVRGETSHHRRPFLF